MDITVIIELSAALIAALITAVAVPYIKSKTTALEQSNINALVRAAVLAAEQLITGAGMGAKRKAYALEFLSKYRLSLDVRRLNTLIESAVYALKNGLL